LRAFRTGKTPILVATGVSARGLDVSNFHPLFTLCMNFRPRTEK
jgi:superfamily II DNA/RNA helicase